MMILIFLHTMYIAVRMSIPDLDFHYRRFLDRVTLLFGESGSGKSVIITDMLFQLKSHIDQVIVISPMDKQNHTYDKGIVPLPCIHYTISAELLNQLWERQEAFVSIYSRANDINVIKRLFMMCPGKEKELQLLTAVEAQKKKCISEVAPDAEAKSKISRMEADYSELVIKVYKMRILKSSRYLSEQKLSEIEAFTLKYIDFNPKLLLIFDDCTDLFKKMKGLPVLQKIFYQGRWNHITCIIALHTDKALDPELKKNAFVTMFTAEMTANSYINRESNDLDREARLRAKDALKSAFSVEYQKLVWIREERKFYKYIATIHPIFRFGHVDVWKFCNKIMAEAGAVNTNNKFLRDFM